MLIVVLGDSTGFEGKDRRGNEEVEEEDAADDVEATEKRVAPRRIETPVPVLASEDASALKIRSACASDTNVPGAPSHANSEL